MQWSREANAGFTRGKPWQPLPSYSLRTTVESQEKDPASLLQLHRRLIHLRADNPALGGGQIVPLTASHDAVAAYLRRDGERTVLVVANLSATPLAGVSLASAERVLPAGSWTPRNLLGGAGAATLRVGGDGRLRGYLPLPTLAPTEGYLFELLASPARAKGR
jgi:glycosidase